MRVEGAEATDRDRSFERFAARVAALTPAECAALVAAHRSPQWDPADRWRAERWFVLDYHRTFDRLLELAKASPDNVYRAMRLIIAARYMERVGDHITNIAEDVVFVSSGEREDLNP